MANISIFSLCLFFATILFAVAGVSAQTRALYGEPCSRTTRCDSRASLTCTNGSCECIMPDVMTYDGAKCAVFAGEKCTFTAVDIQSRGEERSWREELPCVKNSWCQEGFCTCLPEFYESANGTCIKKSDFQENCEFDLACKTDQLLSCNADKKCGCNSHSTYEVSRQRCVTVANASCENDQECVSNAKCTLDGIRSEKVCKCDSGYFANPEGQCETERGYMKSCIDDTYCKHGNGAQDLQLVCNENGVCDCKSNFSMFDTSKQLCVRLAGISCSGFHHCVKDSECSSSTSYICTCTSDYFPTSSRTCERKRNHGKPCQTDTQCSKDLKCGFNGLCECNKGQKVYDPSKQKCVGLADSPCSAYGNERDCVPNAYCWNEYRDGSCRCHDGYTKSQNGSCLASHQRSCGRDWKEACNEEQGTMCQGGVCRCKYESFQTYDSSKGKCVSKVPGPCDGEFIPCVPNAHCSEDEETFRQCECNPGFILVEGHCMLTIGQSCEYQYNRYDEGTPFDPIGKTCDIGAPLKCIAGTCQCSTLEEYDDDELKCRGLVGSECQVGKKGYCTHNANCEARRARSLAVETFGVCKCNVGWQTTRTKRCILEIAMREVREPTEDREIIPDN